LQIIRVVSDQKATLRRLGLRHAGQDRFQRGQQKLRIDDAMLVSQQPNDVPLRNNCIAEDEQSNQH